MVQYEDMGTVRQSVVVKSISLGDGEMKTPARSISFSIKDSESAVMNSLESGKFTLEGIISIERRDSDTVISIKTTSPLCREEKNGPDASIVEECLDNQSPRSVEMTRDSTSFDPCHPRNEAAVKLQKVYKSFRTRRKLADCAVLVEQSWWKLLDFAELKHSSISFFDGEKHETAISKWSRARTRAAKVGKGLSKNDKAQKLALQHWLEAIDPRHRYGHNLHFYYVKWLDSQSREPFFYWLDIGEGKEVNLEKCSRVKLQQQCIKYLGPMERKAYEIAIEDGRLLYKQSGELLDTTGDAKWIFVLSTSKVMYVGKKKKGSFQHSSFLAGGAALAAGRLVVEQGVLKAVWPHSGHYRPTEENFKDFISFLQDNNVDLTDVKLTPVDDDGMSLGSRQSSSGYLSVNLSELDLTKKINDLEIGIHDSSQEKTDSTGSESSKLRRFESFSRKLTNLQIPKQSELFEDLECENQRPVEPNNLSPPESPVADYETAEEQFSLEDNCSTLKPDVSDDEHEESKEKITAFRRISYKEPKTCQTVKQITRKWTSGAGARIGYVRDHPAELQVRALEQLNLSPRHTSLLRSFFPLGSSALSSESSELASEQEAAMPKICLQG